MVTEREREGRTHFEVAKVERSYLDRSRERSREERNVQAEQDVDCQLGPSSVALPVLPLIAENLIGRRRRGKGRRGEGELDQKATFVTSSRFPSLPPAFPCFLLIDCLAHSPASKGPPSPATRPNPLPLLEGRPKARHQEGGGSIREAPRSMQTSLEC